MKNNVDRDKAIILNYMATFYPFLLFWMYISLFHFFFFKFLFFASLAHILHSSFCISPFLLPSSSLCDHLLHPKLAVSTFTTPLLIALIVYQYMIILQWLYKTIKTKDLSIEESQTLWKSSELPWNHRSTVTLQHIEGKILIHAIHASAHIKLNIV